MPSSMENVIEERDEEEITCMSCKKSATSKVLILKATVPSRIITRVNCKHCGFNEVTEEDYETLEYGVEIVCDFTDKKQLQESIRRMVFINHDSEVVVEDSEGEVMEFNTTVANIDCVEGVLERAMAIIESNSAVNRSLEGTIERLMGLKAKGFKMRIKDSTGYSKVCPYGKEYTDVQQAEPEDLNDGIVEHRKYSRPSLIVDGDGLMQD